MGKFVIKNAKNGLKFDLKASNGQVIASSQVYKHKKTCLNGTASVMKKRRANTASASKPPTDRSLPSAKAM